MGKTKPHIESLVQRLRNTGGGDTLPPIYMYVEILIIKDRFRGGGGGRGGGEGGGEGGGGGGGGRGGGEGGGGRGGGRGRGGGGGGGGRGAGVENR